MIGATILMGVLLAIAILWVSIGISYLACGVIESILNCIAKYVDLRKVFMLCVFLVLIHFLYTGIADYILMVFE